MKTKFVCDYSASEVDAFILSSQNQFDTNVIVHWLQNVPGHITDEDSMVKHLLETRERIKCIINAIKTYESDNENNSVDDNMGRD